MSNLYTSTFIDNDFVRMHTNINSTVDVDDPFLLGKHWYRNNAIPPASLVKARMFEQQVDENGKKINEHLECLKGYRLYLSNLLLTAKKFPLVWDILDRKHKGASAHEANDEAVKMLIEMLRTAGYVVKFNNYKLKIDYRQ